MYPENSVGRLMTPDYVAVKPEWTIRYVLDYIREHGADSETLSNIYVVDEHGVLIDDLSFEWRQPISLKFSREQLRTFTGPHNSAYRGVT